MAAVEGQHEGAAGFEIAGEEGRELRAEGGLAEAAEAEDDKLPLSPAPSTERRRSFFPTADEAETQALYAADAPLHSLASARAVQPWLEGPFLLLSEIHRRHAFARRQSRGRILAAVIEGELSPAEGVDVCEAALLLVSLGGDAARTAQSLPRFFPGGQSAIESGGGPGRLLIAHGTEEGHDLGEAGAVEGGRGRGMGFHPGRGAMAGGEKD